MWLVDQVYFLSDRDGPENLYIYDTKSKQVNAALASNGVDIKSASAGPDAIVYEQFGSIHLFDDSAHDLWIGESPFCETLHRRVGSLKSTLLGQLQKILKV